MFLTFLARISLCKLLIATHHAILKPWQVWFDHARVRAYFFTFTFACVCIYLPAPRSDSISLPLQYWLLRNSAVNAADGDDDGVDSAHG